MAYNNEILSWNWIDCGNVNYMISHFSGGVIKVNTDKNEATVFFDRDNWPITMPQRYLSCLKAGDDIFLIPGNADNLGRYNIIDNSFNYYPIRTPIIKSVVKYDPICKFFHGCTCDNSIIFFPNTYPALLQMDMNSGEIFYYDEWINELNTIAKSEACEYYFGDGYVKISNTIYLCMSCCDRIFTINTMDMSIGFMRIDCNVDSFEGIAHEGDFLYLIGKKANDHYLIICDTDGKLCKKIALPFKGNCEWISFLRPFLFGSFVYIMPYKAEHCFSIDLESDDVRVEESLDEILQSGACDDGLLHIKNYKLRGNVLSFQTYLDQKWHKYDMETGKDESYKIVLEDEDYWQEYRVEKCARTIERNGMIVEGDLNLNDYLIYLNSK